MARTQITPTDTVSPSPQVQRLKERVRKKPTRAQQPEPVDIEKCRWVSSGKGGRYEYLVGDDWLTRGKIPHADVSLDRFRKKNPEWKRKSGKPEEDGGGADQQQVEMDDKNEKEQQQQVEVGGKNEKEQQQQVEVESGGEETRQKERPRKSKVAGGAKAAANSQAAEFSPSHWFQFSDDQLLKMQDDIKKTIKKRAQARKNLTPEIRKAIKQAAALGLMSEIVDLS